MAELGRTVSTADSLKKKISAGKATVKSKYSSCKKAAMRLASSKKHLIEAGAKNEAKRTSSSFARLAVAENRYCSAIKEYKTFLSLYDALVDDVLKLYDELVMIENVKGAKRARVAAEKFDTQQSILKESLFMIVKDIDFGETDKKEKNEEENLIKEMPRSEFAESKEEPVQPKVPHQSRQQPPPPPNYSVYATPPYYLPPDYAYRPYQPQGVNIAPMSIDISPIVENAVSEAMEKFKAALGKRVDDAGDAIPKIQEGAGTVPIISEKVASMEEAVAENEQYILEKLASLTENLKKMSDEMTELGAAYMQLANKQKDAVELQRRINDMQRTLSRELQGVQATQKVINQDQADVSAAQAELTEHQRANVENHKLICESQEGIVELEKTIIDTQSVIEESVRNLLGSQKEIIAAQQAVMNANLKNVDLQRELIEKQSEVTNLQKTVISEYKQVSRAQKNLSSRIKSRKQEEKSDAALTEITETLAAEANAIVAKVDESIDEMKPEADNEQPSAVTEDAVPAESAEEEIEPIETAALPEAVELEELNASDAFKE